MTKEAALRILKDLQDAAKKKQDHHVIEALSAALDEVGRCHDCRGAKEVEVLTPPSGPHKVKLDIGRRQRFYVPCTTCAGTGKYLSFNCKSCGVKTKVDVTPKFLSHCATCGERLARKGVL
jgi:hypothetical protein